MNKKIIIAAAAVLILIIVAGLVIMNAQNSGKNGYALIQTDKGNIMFELFEDKAPMTAANFIKLAQGGFYNGLTFHRYEPGFVI